MFDKRRALLDRFLASRRRSAQEAALQLELLAEFTILDRDDLDPTGEFTHLEIAAITHSGVRFVQDWLALASTVTTRLPRTLAALRSGDVDLYHVRRIADATDVLSDELAAQVEDELISRVPEWSPRQLNYHLRRAVNRADPEAAAARATAAQEARHVRHTALDDGAGLLQIQGDAERTQLAHDRVRTIAHQLKTSGDTRTMDQIAADVALDCLAGKDFKHAKIRVWLTLPAVTALGVAEKPGYLAGYGWIPAQRALELAAQEDATWQRVLTDPATGEAIDVGRNKYRPPAALRDHIHTKYPTCTGPGCRRPAHLCDGDHRVPFPEGPTSPENVHPACRPHHRTKTHGGWRIEKTANGTLVWITKHGYRFHHQPDPVADPEPHPTSRLDPSTDPPTGSSTNPRPNSHANSRPTLRPIPSRAEAQPPTRSSTRPRPHFRSGPRLDSQAESRPAPT